MDSITVFGLVLRLDRIMQLCRAAVTRDYLIGGYIRVGLLEFSTSRVLFAPFQRALRSSKDAIVNFLQLYAKCRNINDQQLRTFVVSTSRKEHWKECTLRAR